MTDHPYWNEDEDDWNANIEMDALAETDTDQDNGGIQAILDRGYATLDRFVAWLEEMLDIDNRTAQQDAFNAEALLDYLANYHRKPVHDINEFELRWFVFSHYIRKAMADDETEEHLVSSLQRFFEYLRVRENYIVPEWLYSVLDDQPFFLSRRKAYHELDSIDERNWEVGFRAWCEELEEDLDVRCLWLPRDLGEGYSWEEKRGWREATLYDEANQNWQEERAELLKSGLDYEAARSRLLTSYLLWTETEQQKLENRTPIEIILVERQERKELDTEDRPEDDENNPLL